MWLLPLTLDLTLWMADRECWAIRLRGRVGSEATSGGDIRLGRSFPHHGSGTDGEKPGDPHAHPRGDSPTQCLRPG